jgi:hypothetical protein
LVSLLPTGVPKGPGTRLQPSGDVAGLLIRSWEFGFINRKLLGHLLLAQAVPDGRQVAGACVQHVQHGGDRFRKRDAGGAVALLWAVLA